MCFYLDDGDCAWSVGHQEDEEKPSDKDRRCEECGAGIKAGELARHIYQQEADESNNCPACENGNCECEDGECCKCAEPSVGETFECWQCVECAKFLQAVKSAEIKAGCHSAESQPYLGQMIESIIDGEPDEAKKYFKESLVLYPELKTSGYLGRLWNRMFV